MEDLRKILIEVSEAFSPVHRLSGTCSPEERLREYRVSINNLIAFAAGLIVGGELNKEVVRKLLKEKL